MQPNRHVSEEELVTAYQECYNSPAGKIVLAHLVSKFGFTGKSTHVPGDPCATEHHEGQRMVLVFIGKMLSIGPDDLKRQKHTEEQGDEG